MLRMMYRTMERVKPVLGDSPESPILTEITAYFAYGREG
jgi:hypothetical protein